jgi:putative tryptophan/tyrosine transport system substrate-binding protein
LRVAKSDAKITERTRLADLPVEDARKFYQHIDRKRRLRSALPCLRCCWRRPMRRRQLIGFLVGSALPRLPAAKAQPRRSVHRLGVLMATRANDTEGRAYAAALMQGLAAAGWQEGGNLRIDWRWADADPALFQRSAAELVAPDPDVIVAFTSPAVAALRRETNTIPIVFTVVPDPVGQGFVKSLAHPGGNITGFSAYNPPIAGKWLQMLTEIRPLIARVAVLYNPPTAPFAGPMLGTISRRPRPSP